MYNLITPEWSQMCALDNLDPTYGVVPKTFIIAISRHCLFIYSIFAGYEYLSTVAWIPPTGLSQNAYLIAISWHCLFICSAGYEYLSSVFEKLETLDPTYQEDDYTSVYSQVTIYLA
jgi:hypothetical protein